MSYSNPDLLVSPKWLLEHKDDADLVVVDCPWDSGSYTRAHIPGAVCRPGHAYVKGTDAIGEPTLLLPSEAEIVELAASIRVGPGTTAVLYDEWGSIFATRLWWVLR